MNSSRVRLGLVAIGALWLFAGCGSGVSRFAPTAGVSFEIKLANDNTVTSSSRTARTVVTSSTSGLGSLQLFVKSIGICLNLTVTATDYSAGLNCASLYTGPGGLDQSDASTDQSSLAQQARGTSAHFTDLMSGSARQSFAQGAGGTAVPAGAYNWGYVQWAPPIKVQATLFNPSGNAFFYTQDGTTTGMNGGDGYAYVTTSSTPFTSGSAQTAVVIERNFGSWFRLLTPFTIAQSDVIAQTSFVVDLVFDPVGFVTGADSTITGAVLADMSSDTIQVPEPEFLPIEHSPGQTVMKESYVANDTTNGYDIHLDLYYVQGDSDKTIRAAGVRALPNAASTTPLVGALSRVAFLRQNSDGTTDFLDYANNPIITGLTRGQAGTVTVACLGAAPTSTFNPVGCSGGSVSESFAAPTTASLN